MSDGIYIKHIFKYALYSLLNFKSMLSIYPLTHQLLWKFKCFSRGRTSVEWEDIILGPEKSSDWSYTGSWVNGRIGLPFSFLPMELGSPFPAYISLDPGLYYITAV